MRQQPDRPRAHRVMCAHAKRILRLCHHLAKRLLYFLPPGRQIRSAHALSGPIDKNSLELPLPIVGITACLQPARPSSAGFEGKPSSGKGGAKPFPLPAHPYLHPRLSPDDRQLAVEIEGPVHDSYFYDISREALTRFSFDGATHWPVWSPRGDRITFRSGRTTPMSMWWMPADRSGTDERLTLVQGPYQNPESWSPDGRALLFTQKTAAAGGDIFVLPIDGGRQPRPLVQTKFDEGSPKFSRDGTWVAYSSNESGQPEVYVTPYPGPGARIQVSNDGGNDPVWRRKGESSTTGAAPT